MTPHQLNRGSLEFLKRFRIAPDRRPVPSMTPVWSPKQRANREVTRICEALGVPVWDVKSPKKDDTTCFARFIVMYCLRNELGMTLKATGQIMGRDHATVKWGLSRYDELKFTKNPAFLEMLGKIDGSV